MEKDYYWNVKIGWEDSRGYCETCRHIDGIDALSVLDAIGITAEWSTGCPDTSLWKLVECERVER
jgi:hypothetical protein